MRWLMIAALLVPFAAQADMDTRVGRVSVTPVMSGLEDPWGFDFLPGGGVLVTQLDGSFVARLPDGKTASLPGPDGLAVVGQGGLLDVMVPADFAKTGEVYYSFAKKQRGGSGTALGRMILTPQTLSFKSHETLFEIAAGSSGGRHFGSRIVEGRDGHIYMSVGDRGDRSSAQDLTRENGSILRLTRDGTVPADNPFNGSAIWSYGHRNPQGLTVAPDGNIFAIEHGPKGGDEINRIRKGRNYGWPVISYGTHYSGGTVGEGTAKAGMEQPMLYWDPSIAPSGAMVYSGKLWTKWKNHIFTGSLKFDNIQVASPGAGSKITDVLRSAETQRVRDVDEAPDGSIWFLSQPEGRLYRLSPHGN